ncbi:MAG TPA: hypothetical protein VGS19_01465 [Streptosporangiaceae bacterium]|nr:hypothetical protein [Streptosporangiaceae bacterium]
MFMVTAAAVLAGPAASASTIRAQSAAAAYARGGGGQLSAPAQDRRVKYFIIPEPKKGQEPVSLSDIAQATLGNAKLFKELFQINKGRLQPNGKRMESPNIVEPGWIIILPPSASGPGVHFGHLPVVSPPAPHPHPHAHTSPSATPASSPSPASSPTTTASQPVASGSSAGSPGGPNTMILVGWVLIIIAGGAGLTIAITQLRRDDSSSFMRHVLPAHARPSLNRLGRQSVSFAADRPDRDSPYGGGLMAGPRQPGGYGPTDGYGPSGGYRSLREGRVSDGAGRPSLPARRQTAGGWSAPGGGGPPPATAGAGGFDQAQYGGRQYSAPQYSAPEYVGPQYSAPQFDGSQGSLVSPQWDGSQHRQQSWSSPAGATAYSSDPYSRPYPGAQSEAVLTHESTSGPDWANRGLGVSTGDILPVSEDDYVDRYRAGPGTELAVRGRHAAGLDRTASARLAARILSEAETQALEMYRQARESAAAIREAAEADAAALWQRVVNEDAALRQVAEQEAANLRQHAADQAATIRETVEHEVADLKRQAAEHASQIREAAAAEAAQLHDTLTGMTAELARITENFTRPPKGMPSNAAAAAAPAAAAPTAAPARGPRPAGAARAPAPEQEDLGQGQAPAAPARPRPQPGTRPTRPGARPAEHPGRPAQPGKPHTKGVPRQLRAARIMVGVFILTVTTALTAGAVGLAEHGFQFFVFRSAGTGATDNNAVFPGIIPPSPQPSPHHPSPSPTPGHRGAHHRHHHPGTNPGHSHHGGTHH